MSKKLITLFIILIFIVQTTGISYALRPIASKNGIGTKVESFTQQIRTESITIIAYEKGGLGDIASALSLASTRLAAVPFIH